MGLKRKVGITVTCQIEYKLHLAMSENSCILNQTILVVGVGSGGIVCIGSQGNFLQ